MLLLEGLTKSGRKMDSVLRLYNAIVVSTLLYRSETWPMTVASRRRLEVAHRRWLRRILHVSWCDKITNKSIREKTGQEDMEGIIWKRRLRWLGHMWPLDKDRRANQMLHWVLEGRKRRGRPWKNWTETIKNNL